LLLFNILEEIVSSGKFIWNLFSGFLWKFFRRCCLNRLRQCLNRLNRLRQCLNRLRQCLNRLNGLRQ
jgi:hypothetical protein